MEVDELQRRKLFNDLDRAIGPESAAVLMTYLPPAGWADLATKGDLDIGRSETKAEFASARRELDVLRTETKAEFASARRELDVLRTETRAEFKAVRAEMAAEFASVRQDIASLRSETKAEFKAVRAEMTAEFATVRETVAQGYEIVGKGLTADFRKEMVDMTHKLYFALAGLLVGAGGLAMGIAQIVP